MFEFLLLNGLLFFEPDGMPAGSSGDGGNQPPAAPSTESEPAYLSQLSPELREKSKDYFAEHLKLNDLANAYVTAKDSLKRAIIIPDKDKATPEERSAFFKKMGIPESVTGYGEFEGEKENADFAKFVKEQSLKQGLTKSQSTALWNALKASAGEELKEREAALKKQESDLPQQLQELYGNDKGKADAAISRNKAFWVRLGNEELLKALNNAGFLSNPAFVDFVASVEGQLGDNKLMLGSGGVSKPRSVGRMGSNYHPDFLKEAGA